MSPSFKGGKIRLLCDISLLTVPKYNGNGKERIFIDNKSVHVELLLYHLLCYVHVTDNHFLRKSISSVFVFESFLYFFFFQFVCFTLLPIQFPHLAC